MIAAPTNCCILPDGWPAPLPTAAQCPRALVHLEVAAHPQGGWTHAAPIDATRGTARIYRGWWATERAAAAALESQFS